MEIINLLALAFMTASWTAWLLTLGHKWNIIPKLQAHSPNTFFEKLFGCDFCMSWWLGVATAIVLAVCLGDAWVLLTPFVSAKISAKLME